MAETKAGEVADSTVVYIRFSGTFPELKHRCRYLKERMTGKAANQPGVPGSSSSQQEIFSSH